MHLLTSAITLTLALTASALPTTPSLTNNFARRSTCSSLGTTTTTVGGTTVTLTGPFRLQASGSLPSNLAGDYARAGSPNPPLPFVIYGIKSTQPKRAANFYLDSNSNLVTIQNDVLLTAYENAPAANSGHVAIGTSSQIGSSPLLTCSVAGDTCALSCSVAGFTNNCLASPKFQPDWRIAGPPRPDNKGCLPFTPTVIPV